MTISTKLSLCVIAVILPAIWLPLLASQADQEMNGARVIESQAMQSPRDAGAAELTAIEALVRSKQYKDAESRLRGFLAVHPRSADGHFLLGYVLYRENRPTDSLAEYTRGASYRTPATDDLAAVSMDYILLHDYADADKWLTKAASWDPGNLLDWYYLGRTKYAENRFEESIAAFRQCLALHPKDIAAEYNLGLAYEGLEQNSQAATAFENAISWQSSASHPDPQPYLDLGILLLSENRDTEALSNLKTATELDIRNPKAHQELGEAYEKLNDLPKAQLELERAVSLAENVPALHFELGRIYRKEGLRAKAKEQFARCAALNAGHTTEAEETPDLTYPE
jgi:tetratricopeptide (TPR) repeat protein